MSDHLSSVAGDMHERTRQLIGDSGLAKLTRSRVAVIGLGGVGSAAAEQLCRAGIGRLTLVDFDVVRESNLNRQLFAVRSTVGQAKTEVAAQRLRDINPACVLDVRTLFFDADTARTLELEHHDYVLDCIDSLSPKVQLIHFCARRGIPVITSSGAASKTDPSGVQVTDLFETRNCPLARHVRRRLRNVGVRGGITTVHSPVHPRKNKDARPEVSDFERGRPRTPLGSISYLPVLFGCIMAGQVVRELLGEVPSRIPLLDRTDPESAKQSLGSPP